MLSHWVHIRLNAAYATVDVFKRKTTVYYDLGFIFEAQFYLLKVADDILECSYIVKV